MQACWAPAVAAHAPLARPLRGVWRACKEAEPTRAYMIAWAYVRRILVPLPHERISAILSISIESSPSAARGKHVAREKVTHMQAVNGAGEDLHLDVLADGSHCLLLFESRHHRAPNVLTPDFLHGRA
ncbi:MAG: hypothetical protein HC869_10305 [Rhodospirillales bacterium]|nr:hypothetical protein [Rhodospirillales bacterium]